MSTADVVAHVRRALELARGPAGQVRALACHANAHFPGLYRVTCAVDPAGLRTRMYVAPPGGLHPWLTDPESPFLWHGHACDFRSTTLLGTVEQRLLRWAGGDWRDWARSCVMWEHAVQHVDAGLTVAPVEPRRMVPLAPTVHVADGATASYALTGERVHRVAFAPDPATGWFAALIEETAHRHPSWATSAWSTRRLTTADLPGAGTLYRPMDVDDLRSLVLRAECELR